MVAQGRAYMYVVPHIYTNILSMVIMHESEQCKAKVSELKEQEGESDDILKDAMRLWSAHEVT